MKTLILTALLFLFSTPALSRTAWYFDVDRSGEGIILTELPGGGVGFALFTHTDGATSVLPTVSPAPPPPALRSCARSSTWFTGFAEVIVDGVAIGQLLYDEPLPEYPRSRDSRVSTQHVVGTFLLERQGDGFRLLLESNHMLPDMSIFHRDFKFVTVIAE